MNKPHNLYFHEQRLFALAGLKNLFNGKQFNYAMSKPNNKQSRETLNNSPRDRSRRAVSGCEVKFCDFCPELRHFLHYSPVFRF